jgi:hypothetical protein
LSRYNRQHIMDLVATLSDESVAGDAGDELRTMIDRITVRHDPVAGHSIELEGKIVELLQAGSAKAKSPASGGAYAGARSSFELVAGAGSDLHLLREQVKMVAGTGIDHNLQSTPVKMVAGGCNHHYLRPTNSHFPINAKSNAGRMVAKNSSFHSVLFRTAA